MNAQTDHEEGGTVTNVRSISITRRHDQRLIDGLFYVLVLGTVLFLSWLAVVEIVSPLRTLTATVDRFGQGDLEKSRRALIEGREA